jgi:hypothetical protein
MTARPGPCAVVRFLEVGGERGYRVTTFLEARRLVAYFKDLRAACTAGRRN